MGTNLHNIFTKPGMMAIPTVRPGSTLSTLSQLSFIPTVLAIDTKGRALPP